VNVYGTRSKNIGIPDVIREVKIIFNIGINGVEIPFERTVVYKYNDNVKGKCIIIWILFLR
jgi:hypothetical protein